MNSQLIGLSIIEFYYEDLKQQGGVGRGRWLYSTYNCFNQGLNKLTINSIALLVKKIYNLTVVTASVQYWQYFVLSTDSVQTPVFICSTWYLWWNLVMCLQSKKQLYSSTWTIFTVIQLHTNLFCYVKNTVISKKLHTTLLITLLSNKKHHISGVWD